MRRFVSQNAMSPIQRRGGRINIATNVREALTSVLECIIDAFSKDHEAAYLLLFE